MDDKWSAQLRKKLAHHKDAVPNDLWDRIESRMDRISELQERKKRQNKRRMYTAIWSGAIAAGIVLALLPGSNQNMPAVSPVPTIPPVLQGTTEPVAMEAHPLSVRQTKPSGHRPVATAACQKTAGKASLTASDPDQMKPQKTDQNRQRGLDSVSEPARELERIRYPQANPSGSIRKRSVTPDDKHQKNKRWALAMAASQGISQSQLSYGGQGDINNGKIHAATINGSTWGKSHLTDILLYNQNAQPETDIRHHQPITGGIRFQYRLNDRWRLESGLTYTLLRSDLRSGSENYFYETRQKVHLLGIPVKASFVFWNNRHMQTYAQAGMVFEKDVAGTETTDFFKEREKVGTESNRLHIHGMHYTALCGAGIQFNLTRHLGIYAEPGLAWHIVPDKSIQTIYTDKPLNFNIELGMRLCW